MGQYVKKTDCTINRGKCTFLIKVLPLSTPFLINALGVEGVMWRGNFPNSADFLASYSIYTFFQRSYCFACLVVFWNGKTKKL